MRTSCLFLFSSLILATAALPARADLFLKYGNITGDVTTAGYVGDIELNSFSLSVSRAVSNPTGGSSQRETSAPLFSDAALEAPSSSADVPLFSQALQGEGQNASIFITQTIQGNVVTFAEWDFTNTLIDSFSTASDGDRPEDSLSLNFTKVTYKWSNFDNTGTLIGSESVTYDLTNGLASSASLGDTAGFAFITSVPEPASALLLLAAAPLFLKRRR